MTVAQLKALLAGIPNDAEILVPVWNHSYRKAMVTSTTAVYYESSKARRHDLITEDFGKDNETGGVRRPILLIS